MCQLLMNIAHLIHKLTKITGDNKYDNFPIEGSSVLPNMLEFCVLAVLGEQPFKGCCSYVLACHFTHLDCAGQAGIGIVRKTTGHLVNQASAGIMNAAMRVNVREQVCDGRSVCGWVGDFLLSPPSPTTFTVKM